MISYKKVMGGAIFNARKGLDNKCGVPEYYLKTKTDDNTKDITFTFGVYQNGIITPCYQYTSQGYDDIIKYQPDREALEKYLKKRAPYSVMSIASYMCAVRIKEDLQGNITFPKYELYIPVQITEYKDWGYSLYCYDMSNQDKVSISKEILNSYQQTILNQIREMDFTDRVDFIIKRAGNYEYTDAK